MKVHYVAFSSQPDIQICCDGSWTTPEWTQPPNLNQGVYLACCGRLYCFDTNSVTCSECLENLHEDTV